MKKQFVSQDCLREVFEAQKQAMKSRHEWLVALQEVADKTDLQTHLQAIEGHAQLPRVQQWTNKQVLQRQEVSTVATKLLSPFLSKENRDAFVGDLEERYLTILKHTDLRSAQRWFWRQVIQSLFPLVVAAVRRVSGFERLMEFYRRKRS